MDPHPAPPPFRGRESHRSWGDRWGSLSGSGHCGSRPASLTTCCAIARSCLISAANCSGVLAAGTRLRAVRWRSRNAGSPTMLATSLASLSTIGFGVPAGVNSPYQLRDGAPPIAGIGHCQDVGEIRRADIVEHDERRHGAGADLPDDVALADERDGG